MSEITYSKFFPVFRTNLLEPRGPGETILCLGARPLNPALDATLFNYNFFSLLQYLLELYFEDLNSARV